MRPSHDATENLPAGVTFLMIAVVLAAPIVTNFVFSLLHV